MPKDVKFISALKRILKYAKGFKKGFIIVIVLSIISALFSVITPYLLGLITTSLFDSITSKTPVDYNFIYKMMIILAILYILYATFNYLKSFISVNIAQKLCFNIRSDLIKQINKNNSIKTQKCIDKYPQRCYYKTIKNNKRKTKKKIIQFIA